MVEIGRKEFKRAVVNGDKLTRETWAEKVQVE